MSYGADFPAADLAGAPLDPPMLIGADAFVWGAILLAILAALLIGWVLRGQSGGSRADAAEAIWKAVDNAVKEAMKANTEALPARAAELRRVLDARLGKTLKFGGELTGGIKALDTAIKGEIEDKTATPPVPPTPEPVKTQVSDKDAAGGAASASVTIVSVHPQPAPASPPAPPPPPAKPGKRQMTTREQNDALRLAVVALDDYWRHKKAREDDIRSVVAELTNPGPKPSSASGRVSGTAAGH